MKKAKEKKELHIQEIPKKYFPRKTKAKEFRTELIRMMSNLRYTNERVQYNAQLCSFNIRSIAHKSGFVPEPSEVFRQIEGFVYHYENYCFRAYAFREKLLKFINAIFALNFEDRDVKIKFIKNSPVVSQARLVSMLEKFDKKKSLGKVIEDRNSLTHRLYYGKTFDHYLRPMPTSPANEAEFKKWLVSWRKEIINRSKLTEEFTYAVFNMNHELARKIIQYKDSLKKSRPRRLK